MAHDRLNCLPKTKILARLFLSPSRYLLSDLERAWTFVFLYCDFVRALVSFFGSSKTLPTNQVLAFLRGRSSDKVEDKLTRGAATTADEGPARLNFVHDFSERDGMCFSHLPLEYVFVVFGNEDPPPGEERGGQARPGPDRHERGDHSDHGTIGSPSSSSLLAGPPPVASALGGRSSFALLGTTKNTVLVSLRQILQKLVFHEQREEYLIDPGPPREDLSSFDRQVDLLQRMAIQEEADLQTRISKMFSTGKKKKRRGSGGGG